MVNIKNDSYKQILICNQRIDYEDGDSIFFKTIVSFEQLSTVNTVELRKTLGSAFKKRAHIYDAVKIIRTVFKDYKELELYISTFNYEKEKTLSCVTYKNGELIEYEEHKKIDDEFLLQTKIDQSGFTFNWLNNSFDEKQIGKFKDIISAFKSLSTVEPYQITNNDRVLCTVFEQFYDRMPDFRNNDDVERAQFLIFYLYLFDICLLEEQQIIRCRKNYPIDTGLYMQADKIMLFGDTNESINRITFKESFKELEAIKRVFYRVALEDNIDIGNVKTLQHISAIAYTDRFAFMRAERPLEEYQTATALTSLEASKSLKFYRRIVAEKRQ